MRLSRSFIGKLLPLASLLLIFPVIPASAASAQAVTPRPCDIFALATPCVAAISTTRALYSAYTGPLYQVTRQSDSKRTKIGLLPDGYANAAKQDAFCANTTCTITTLYDQSRHHNNLTPAPPGGNASGHGPNGHDLPVAANALPITVAGHKVYGMLFSPGMGYRNDKAKHTAVNGQPEGVYMLTSTLHLNQKCCFDFGNAETNNLDNGSGHMDAINIKCRGKFRGPELPPCIPVAGLDMENGIPGDFPVTPDATFATVMGANDGQHTFAIYAGNAQSGTLTSTGAIPLPSGYQPMKQEGAIILGIGGDNSDRAEGYFFEGVMTSGEPTAQALEAIQTNIISAHYTAISAPQATAQTPADFALLKQHMREFFWQQPSRNDDQLATKRPSSTHIDQWAQSLQPNGSWPDINYADQTRDAWHTEDHLKRTLSMAKAYAQQQASGHSDPTLRHAILSATDYWTAKDLQNPNWWWNTIGMPNDLSDIMLLMEDDMSPAEMAAGLKILRTVNIGRTGQNLAWQAGIVFKTAVLEDNQPLAAKARAAILSQIAVTTDEGLQPDDSFHQHGPQQQMGNYGLAFAGETVDWAYQWRGTPWAIPPAQLALIRNFLLHGEAVVVANATMDISACDRQLSPNSPEGKGETVLNLLRRMTAIDPAHTADYRAAIAADSRPADSHNHATPSAPPTTLDKNFYRSDYLVHRRPGWYASVKMSSRRVRGEEMVNRENLSGRYLADGALFLYQTSDEYTNIFPVWDWRRLPGVTDAATGDDLKPTTGFMPTDFAGGVSNGLYGAAALDDHRDGVSAKKSWFFFDHEIICLGAAIHSDSNTPSAAAIDSAAARDLVTGIEQSLLQGKIYAALGTSAPTEQPTSTHTLTNARWLWHNDRGYYFPQPQPLVVSGASQTGTWTNIYDSAKKEAITRDVFSLWLDHGAARQPASYSYVVLPVATRQQVADYAAHPAIQVLSNTPQVQAVTDPHLALTMVVFFAPGKLETSLGTLTVDKPCALLLDAANGQVKLTISDPSQHSKHIQVTLQGKTISVELPQHGDAGKSVEVML